MEKALSNGVREIFEISVNPNDCFYLIEFLKKKIKYKKINI